MVNWPFLFQGLLMVSHTFVLFLFPFTFLISSYFFVFFKLQVTNVFAVFGQVRVFYEIFRHKHLVTNSMIGRWIVSWCAFGEKHVLDSGTCGKQTQSSIETYTRCVWREGAKGGYSTKQGGSMQEGSNHDHFHCFASGTTVSSAYRYPD